MGKPGRCKDIVKNEILFFIFISNAPYHIYHNFANAELEKLDGNMKGYETFREYMQESLNKGSRILILPRHVIEEF